MRVLLLSDIHANIDALDAVCADAWREPSHFDDVWVLGDLVDYGGAPADVIAWVREHATRVVRGNHDHAMGTGEDCRSAPLYHDLAVATREYFRPQLTESDRAYLADLPLQLTVALPSARQGMLVHASPVDQLFGYVPTQAPDATWRTVLGPARCRLCVSRPHARSVHSRDRFDDRRESWQCRIAEGR